MLRTECERSRSGKYCARGTGYRHRCGPRRAEISRSALSRNLREGSQPESGAQTGRAYRAGTSRSEGGLHPQDRQAVFRVADQGFAGAGRHRQQGRGRPVLFDSHQRGAHRGGAGRRDAHHGRKPARTAHQRRGALRQQQGGVHRHERPAHGGDRAGLYLQSAFHLRRVQRGDGAAVGEELQAGGAVRAQDQTPTAQSTLCDQHAGRADRNRFHVQSRRTALHVFREGTERDRPFAVQRREGLCEFRAGYAIGRRVRRRHDAGPGRTGARCVRTRSAACEGRCCEEAVERLYDSDSCQHQASEIQ